MADEGGAPGPMSEESGRVAEQETPAMETGGDDAVNEVHTLESVAILFAGDSGDGMQLTGTQFSNTAAIVGNDISTLPSFPAEIRAPSGTLPGVSGFQVRIGSTDIFTPGDRPRVLVAMNPAALKVSLPDLEPGGIIIIDTDSLTPTNLRKARYEKTPLADGSLRSYRVCEVPLTTLNRKALAEVEGLTSKQVDMMKNMFALGLTFWIFGRPLDPTVRMVERKFAHRPAVVEGNLRALRAGYNFGVTTQQFQFHYHVPRAAAAPGTYRAITGNEALSLGLVAAAHLAGKSLFYGSYPITPASTILEELAGMKNYRVRTFQAEDEIAAMGAVIGAAFAGALAATGTSGPGVCLKSEAINLAIVMELPMVIVNVQRAGPSTGLPTKAEQSDLLQAFYGRNGDSPIPILAPESPTDCFEMAIEAFRIAVASMTPVFLLSDGNLANSSEPWRIPDVSQLKPIEVTHWKHAGHFEPYRRNSETLARPWALPGTKGMEHRIGGLEKQDGSGEVSYEPADHEQMTQMRHEKIARIAHRIPPLEVWGPPSGELLVLGWGNTFGAIHTAVGNAMRAGKRVAGAHLRYLNPFPANLGEVLTRYEKVLVPEMNMGQLSVLLQSQFEVRVHSFSKVRGTPIKIAQIAQKIDELMTA
ncbi:2-oxoacid:acceptor oxidoreductase subunit alpha [Candidatus Latescibacterota bacterium]